MKRSQLQFIFFTFSVCLFATTTAFGQNPLRQLKWEPWETLPCYQGISVSVMKMGFSKDAGGYLWGIRFRNDYNIPVTLGYKLTIGEESKSKQGYLSVYKLGPGKIMTDGNDLFTGKLYNSPSSEYFIYLDKVCFDGMKCGGAEECYADCDKTPGKPNQLCGLNDNAAKEEKTIPVESNSSPSSEDKPDSPSEKSFSSLNGQWQRDDKGLNVTVITTVDGLSWTKDGSSESYIFKKIAADTYRFESGKNFYIVKIISDKRLSYWENGSLAFFYNRASFNADDEKKTLPNENKPVSIEGDYIGEGIYSTHKLKIALTPEGITETNSSYGGVSWPYKKIELDTYRYTYTGSKGSDYFTIKFINSNTIQVFRGMSDVNGNFYHRISASLNKEQIEAKKLASELFNITKNSSLAGTWDGDNGGTGIITMTDNGFNWANKGQGFSSFFKKIASDTYRFEDGKNFCIVKFISDTKLDYSCNGTHYAYFNRR